MRGISDSLPGQALTLVTMGVLSTNTLAAVQLSGLDAAQITVKAGSKVQTIDTTAATG